MKKAIMFFVLYACFAVVQAQTSPAKTGTIVDRHMGLEASVGYSIPLGTYASSDKQDNKAGFTTGGWQMQLTFDWMGKKDFGLAIQYTFQKNPMENAVNLVYPYTSYPDSLNPGQIPNSRNPSWSNHYLLAGPVFMKTFNKLHVDAKIMGGVVVSTGASFDTRNPYAKSAYDYNENIATGFAYQISAGTGYTISSHVAFKFNLNLLGGWPGKNRQYPAQLLGYKEYIDPLSGMPYYKAIYSAPITNEIKKVVTTLNPSIGLVYRF